MRYSRMFYYLARCCSCFVFLALALRLDAAVGEKWNFLLITTDDMSCDSVGAYGCKLPGTTPHMDRLSERALRFNHAFVQVGNCFPSRNVMWSGRYPHTTRVEGFYQIKDADYPHLSDLMKEGGWFTAIRGKISHSTPYSPYPAWDLELDTLPDGTRAHTKDARSYYASTRQGIARAREAGKPFCININISDPHKPFYAEGGKPDPHVPSRVYTADEVPIPGFLFDDPHVRIELAEYYSSVRRADDCLGEILRALDESGLSERTVIFFLSDHGMPLPFAKTQLYYHSTRTPLMILWPGVTKSGAVEDEHLVSAVDLLPTLLDIASLQHPVGMDGRSFAPILRGERQDGRDFVVTEYNENSRGDRHPMRSIITREHAYIFNPWADGTRVMTTATQGTVTYRRMKLLARTDPALAERLTMLDHRAPEELYHYAYDPDALTNLMGRSDHADIQSRLTSLLEDWMVRTRDPMLHVFRQRHDPAVCDAYVTQVQAEAEARRANTYNQRAEKKAAAKGAKASPRSNPIQMPGLIQMQIPSVLRRGARISLGIVHKLPTELGIQKLHVTLKDDQGRRIERQVISIGGSDTASVYFSLPADYSGKGVSFAAFVGEEFEKKLQHLQSEIIHFER